MIISIALILVLIMSAVVHEVAHGWMALKLGDTTARDAGRLTLNPIKHLDPIGSVLLPAFFILTKSSFFFAWAKPVPFNPYRLSDKKYGALKVALAGPMSNLCLAVFFGLLARALPIALETKQILLGFLMGGHDDTIALMSGNFLYSVFVLASMMTMVNLALMAFNLIPWPPLDGSKIIFPFLPLKLKEFYYKLEGSIAGLLILFSVVYLGVFDFLGVIIGHLFVWLLGI